jgi:glycosyltransferase involved in cell wall biosynthesis
MSAGIPIICSDFPVWKELIDETVTGICVDAKNEGEIKAAIEYLNNNRDVAREMGSNGRLSIENQYNWKNEAEKLYNLYLKLAKENA